MGDVEKDKKKRGTRRLVLATNLVLAVVLVGLVVLIATDFVRPSWLPVGLGIKTTTVTVAVTDTSASTTAGTTTAAPTTIGTTPTEWSVQAEVDKATPKSTLGGLRLYQDLVTWDEYTDTEIHQAYMPQKLNSVSGFFIQFIDAESNLYVESLIDPSHPDSIQTLGIYNLTDGTYKPFAEAASNRYTVSFLAISEKYIVWQEGLHAQMGEIMDPVIHVYVKETGEDITFAMPNPESSYYDYRSIGPTSPVLILDDTVYFSAVTKIESTPPMKQYQDLYQFNISTRKSKCLTVNATCPFLYNKEPAWFSLDYERKVSTAMTASGAIDGMPDVPLGDCFLGKYNNNTTVINDRMFIWDQGHDHGLAMIENKVLTLIIAGEAGVLDTNGNLVGGTGTSIDAPDTNGNFIVFRESRQASKLIFDVNRSVLVDITNMIGNKVILGIFNNKIYLVENAGIASDDFYTPNLYWIDLDELG